MNEHLLGSKINDQKAHLQKVQEDTRVANAELSRVLGLIEQAKTEHRSVQRAISDARAELAPYKDAVVSAKREAQRISALSQKTIADAQTRSDLIERESKLTVDAAGKKVQTADAELQRMTQQCESVRVHIAQRTEERASLEARIAGLSEELRTLRETRARDAKTLTTQINALKEEIEARNAELDLVESRLEQAKRETATLFENLDLRERKVKIAENDIAILQGRLRFLIEEQHKKLRHG